MVKITNGKTEFEVETKDKSLLFTLSAAQYQYQNISRFEPFLKFDHQLLNGEILNVTDEELVLSYAIPDYTVSIASSVSEMTEEERIGVARQYSSLFNYETKPLTPFIHPDNLFLSAGQLVIAHRGLTGVIDPEPLSAEEFFNQYKALVLSTLQPKTKFEQLVTGTIKLRDTFSRNIAQAQTVEEVESFLNKQYQVLVQTKKAREVSVKKSNYALFRILLAVFVVIALGLGGWIAYTQISVLPQQSRIVASQSDFINNNFDKATSDLANDNPKQLPKNTQYILAVSYVHLDNLTNDQKTAILNNLSADSSSNEFLYWIAIGRGDLNNALSIAQNIGDNQLILHAYTKLYDATEANTEMNGSQKQSLLSQYQSEITKYLKLIGGQSNG